MAFLFSSVNSISETILNFISVFVDVSCLLCDLARTYIPVLSGYLSRFIYNSFIPIFWLEKSLLPSETFSSNDAYKYPGFENFEGFYTICNIWFVPES